MSEMNDPVLDKLAEDAERFDEFASKKFWVHFFSKHIFYESHLVVSTEQPPVQTFNQRRFDIFVEDASVIPLFLVLAGEAKKGRAGPKDITEAERDVATKCHQYYEANVARNRIWGVTVNGPRFRIFAFDFFMNPEPTAYHPAHKFPSSKKDYLDIRYGFQTHKEVFLFVKENPTPPDSVFGILDTDRVSAVEEFTLEEGYPLQENILVEDEVLMVRAKGKKPGKFMTPEGEIKTLPITIWESAACLVDGQSVMGFKYVGRSDTIYFTYALE